MSQTQPSSVFQDEVYSNVSPLKRPFEEFEDGQLEASVANVPVVKLTRSSYTRKATPFAVVTRDDALALNVSVGGSRVFNGVNYDSFVIPVWVRIDDAEALTGVSKYGKVLFRASEDAMAPYNSTLCVCATHTPVDYAFLTPGNGLDPDTARFKWNVAKAKNCSMLVSRVAVNKSPVQGDRGILILEISGLYRNDTLKTAGVVCRIVSYSLST